MNGALEKAKKEIAKLKQHKEMLEMQLVRQIYGHMSEKLTQAQKGTSSSLLRDFLHAIEDENIEDILAIVNQMLKVVTKGDSLRQEEALTKLHSILLTIAEKQDEK